MDHASLKRYLPHVVVATVLTAVLPALVLLALQLSGMLRSPLLSVALGVVLSSVLANAGSAYWMRRPGSRDIVFGDLLVWGWIRRLRAERRLGGAASLLDDIDLEHATAADPADRVEALQRLASALEARDPYTHGHSRRVTRHAEMIAKKLGLSRAEVAKIRTAAAVHDVGKLRTPREVLNKPGKLTDEEFAVMKRHSSDSAEMAEVIGDDELIAIVRHHHERLDGTGYPAGLSGREIPLGSRIIAVADTFDAMTSSRAYRTARKHDEAIKILKAESGHQLDGEAVDAFLGYYVGRKSVKWWGVLVTAPQRLVELVGVAFHSAGTASIAQGVAAVAATAVVGSSVAGHVVKPQPADAAAGSAGRVAASHAERTPGLETADDKVAGGRSRPGRSARPGSKRSRPRGSAPGRSRPGSGRGSHGETPGGAPGGAPLDAPKSKPSHAGGGGGGSQPASGNKPSEPGRTPQAGAPPAREAPEPAPPAVPDEAREPAAPQPPPPPSPAPGGKGKGAASPTG